MSFTCNDLRLGGTLASGGITGGLSINNTQYTVEDWSGVFGHPGSGYLPVEISGRPGAYLSGDGLGKPRILSLNMVITRRNATGGLTAATFGQQLSDNTDAFLNKLVSPTYLEVDLPDASKRFLSVVAFDPASIGQPRSNRHLSVPLFAASPNWHLGGTQSTYTSGGTLANTGLLTVYDAVVVFAGDGTLVNSTAGWTLTITGSSGAVTVDLGNRTVTQAGIPADQLLTPTDREWGWFLPGNNSLSGTASVTITWRAQYP